jgi:hypothetical protein
MLSRNFIHLRLVLLVIKTGFWREFQGRWKVFMGGSIIGLLIDILYTLDSASNYSAKQKLKP